MNRRITFWRYFALTAVLVVMAGCASEVTTKDPQAHPNFGEPASNLRLLAGRAGLILTGVATGVRYQQDTETGATYTVYTFTNLDPIKDLSGEFGKGKLDSLDLRVFGGLTPDGKEIIRVGMPRFDLGATYLVFIKAGPWTFSPVVGGELGAFRVVRSRTLHYAFLTDYLGRIVVEANADSIKTHRLKNVTFMRKKRQSLPKPQLDEFEGKGEKFEGNTGARQHTPNLDRDGFADIYTEDNVIKIIESEAARRAAGPEDAIKPRMTARVQALQSMPRPPLALDTLKNRIIEIDKRYADEFRPYYATVDLNGRPLGDSLRSGTPTKQ